MYIKHIFTFTFSTLLSTHILAVEVSTEKISNTTVVAKRKVLKIGYDKKSNTTLSHPILFSLVVPPLINNSFGHQLETFTNHQTGMQVEAPRGGDLCMIDAKGDLRYLTNEAGYGVATGQVQAGNALLSDSLLFIGVELGHFFQWLLADQ